MDFRGDERGQPVVIGALLVFAILILAFSGYQAFVVPNQNADVEFSHSQQVQNDMVDLRIAIVKTAIGDSNTSTGVTLGTRYPSRLIALNPPPPSGTLRMTEPGDIVVNPGEGNRDIDPCPGPDSTRAFVYSPDYNEFSEEAPLIYENTVAYSQHRNNGETKEVLKTSQQLVDVEAGVIRLVALQGEYSESSTQRVNVDIIRGETTTHDVTDPEITLPTRIMSQETWEEVLKGNPSIQFQSGESITFQYDGTFEVRCTRVGVNRAPGSSSGGTTQSDRVEIADSQAVASGPTKSNIEFVLENTGPVDITITQIAVDDSTANVDSVNRSNGNELEQNTGNGWLDSKLSVGENPTDLNESASIPGNDDDEFTLGHFRDQDDNRVHMRDNETNITLVFSDGSSRQYTLNT